MSGTKEEPPSMLGERVMVNGIPMLYIPELEFRRLLNEVARLRLQVTELQARGTELVHELRDAQRKLEVAEERAFRGAR